jgi:hypothetical protein
MEVMTARYNLNDFTNITFAGFECSLPEETLSIITELAQQVGSPTYIRTPVFTKRENGLSRNNAIGSASTQVDSFTKKKRRNKPQEVMSDADWDTIRSFQATKIEQKKGLDAQIDIIRCYLNKMTEKNFADLCEQIYVVLDEILCGETCDVDMMRIGNAIFEIASNNRFYSKLYADLYANLIRKYEIMNTIFETTLAGFLTVFDNIDRAVSEEDYDKFCKINLDNERRKSLSSFFVNLTANKIITEDKLIELTVILIKKVLDYINTDGMKSEVDEIMENIAILYSKELFVRYKTDIQDGKSFIQVIEMLARSKAKTFASLSNKTIFKCMDMVEM